MSILEWSRIKAASSPTNRPLLKLSTRHLLAELSALNEIIPKTVTEAITETIAFTVATNIASF